MYFQSDLSDSSWVTKAMGWHNLTVWQIFYCEKNLGEFNFGGWGVDTSSILPNLIPYTCLTSPTPTPFITWPWHHSFPWPWMFQGQFPRAVSRIVGLIYVKWKRSELIGYCANCMTLPFDNTRELDLGVSRLESEMALSEEGDGRLTWHEWRK